MVLLKSKSRPWADNVAVTSAATSQRSPIMSYKLGSKSPASTASIAVRISETPKTSATVASDFNARSCGRYPIFAGRSTEPPAGSSSPRIILISDVFPDPLSPIRQVRPLENTALTPAKQLAPFGHSRDTLFSEIGMLIRLSCSCYADTRIVSTAYSFPRQQVLLESTAARHGCQGHQKAMARSQSSSRSLCSARRSRSAGRISPGDVDSDSQ